ncbi:LytTR family DNA-binding domain-containing protein [Ekhidna sp.]|uniref:LytR/AlgR family response regulator transcription factor n=1 Tax=Ekhidna sp. TaxID=2608089 RepID=UPI00329985D4
MSIIKTLLVDDEPRAIKTLKLLLEKHVPEVNVIGIANNIQQAFTIIRDDKPELVFLDVNMPNGTGLELIERIKSLSVKVILTTAYQEHAIEALRLSVLDYLLKPIDKSELKRAINRYFELTYAEQPVLEAQKITINTADGMHIMELNKIHYIQSDKNYSVFHTEEGTLVSSKSLGYYEQLLHGSFLRIHRSYIVNLNQIKHLKKGKIFQAVLSNGDILEVSKSKKDELMEKFL